MVPIYLQTLRIKSTLRLRCYVHLWLSFIFDVIIRDDIFTKIALTTIAVNQNHNALRMQPVFNNNNNEDSSNVFICVKRNLRSYFIMVMCAARTNAIFMFLFQTIEINALSQIIKTYFTTSAIYIIHNKAPTITLVHQKCTRVRDKGLFLNFKDLWRLKLNNLNIEIDDQRLIQIKLQQYSNALDKNVCSLRDISIARYYVVLNKNKQIFLLQHYCIVILVK